MKILAIGDFHGKFDNKWKRLVQKEGVDVVVSNGDYFPFYQKKLFFKYAYSQKISLWEVIGKKRYKEILIQEIKGGKKALRGLNSLPVPVLTVLGNHDQAKDKHSMDVTDDVNYIGRQDWRWEQQNFFSNILKKLKNIKRIDYSYAKIGDYVFIGMNGSSFPGEPGSRAFKRSKKKLEKLFTRFRKENKEGRVILVAHNSPYRTKLDKIGMKAHEEVRGKHYGSKLSRKIIQKYQPILSLSGHIDEGRGKDKIRKTLCVNSGPAHEGFGAIVELDSGKVKNVRFIR